MQVDTSVAEADVGKLKPDTMATFVVDAYPQERFRGKVRQIRNAAQAVQNVVTYDAVIDVDNPDLKLKPGMTANVTFIYAEKPDVVRIPNAALRFRPPAELSRSAPSASGEPAAASSDRPRGARVGGGPRSAGTREESDFRTVWVLDGPEPRPVRIRIGISDGTLTEVTEGDVRPGVALVTEVVGDGEKSPAAAPPGGAPPGGGLRRVF